MRKKLGIWRKFKGDSYKLELKKVQQWTYYLLIYWLKNKISNEFKKKDSEPRSKEEPERKSHNLTGRNKRVILMIN